jgi:hypothetical protein
VSERFSICGVLLAALLGPQACKRDEALPVPRSVRSASDLDDGALQATVHAAFLKSKELEPVRSPDRVESLGVRGLVEPSDHTISPTVSNLPGRFAILPGAIAVEPGLAADVSRIVLDPASYDAFDKACIFQPGVAFRYWKGDKAVDLLICFHCTDLAFQVVGAPEALGGKMSFGPGRLRLVALVKTARPADQRLRELQ